MEINNHNWELVTFFNKLTLTHQDNADKLEVWKGSIDQYQTHK